MSEWKDVNEELPPAGKVVFVRGEPYANRPVMIGLGVLDVTGEWFAPDSIFGWYENLLDANPDDMDDLDVKHWRPLPDWVYVDIE